MNIDINEIYINEVYIWFKHFRLFPGPGRIHPVDGCLRQQLRQDATATATSDVQLGRTFSQDINLCLVNLHTVNLRTVNLHTFNLRTVNLRTVNLRTVNFLRSGNPSDGRLVDSIVKRLVRLRRSVSSTTWVSCGLETWTLLNSRLAFLRLPRPARTARQSSTNPSGTKRSTLTNSTSPNNNTFNPNVRHRANFTSPSRTTRCRPSRVVRVVNTRATVDPNVRRSPTRKGLTTSRVRQTTKSSSTKNRRVNIEGGTSLRHPGMRSVGTRRPPRLRANRASAFVSRPSSSSRWHLKLLKLPVIRKSTRAATRTPDTAAARLRVFRRAWRRSNSSKGPAVAGRYVTAPMTCVVAHRTITRRIRRRRQPTTSPSCLASSRIVWHLLVTLYNILNGFGSQRNSGVSVIVISRVSVLAISRLGPSDLSRLSPSDLSSWS